MSYLLTTVYCLLSSSLVAQTLDGVEARSLARGQDAEGEADEDRDEEPRDDRPCGDGRGQRRQQEGDDLADADRDDDADDAAHRGERHRLVEELADDVAAARAERLAHANLLRQIGRAHV